MTSFSDANMRAPVEVGDLTEDGLKDAAKHAAKEFRNRVAEWTRNATPEHVIRQRIRQVCKRHNVDQPDKPGIKQLLDRLSDSAWWRGALRKRFRLVEHAAIKAGEVHCKAGIYVSNPAMVRHQRNQARNADTINAMQVVNQSTGEVMELKDVAEKSLANPANRFAAMMVRIKGIEARANEKGHIGLFLTVTCPSRMHARHSKSGEANERYDGTNPRQAQAHLCKLWKDVGRNLGHQGIGVSGLRVVEPHHDACPHWHLLAFVPPSQADALIDTVRRYAMSDSPGEPGAIEHRFKVERIDAKKGSAAGYVVKYIAKSINGHGVDVDHETGATGTNAASRIVAWSSQWGIRQFQFFGTGAITPVRELFRVDSKAITSPGLQAAHVAIKANDYGSFLNCVDAHGLKFGTVYTQRKNARYQDEFGMRILGVDATERESIFSFVTRAEEWRIEIKPDASKAAKEALNPVFVPPWTRINNCAPVDFEGFFQTGFEISASEKSTTQKKCPHPVSRLDEGVLIQGQARRSIPKPSNRARTSALNHQPRPDRGGISSRDVPY